jgi:hypothetical protein
MEDDCNENDIQLHDSFGLELSENFVIETGVVGFTEDGIIIHLDEDAMEFLDFNGVLLESEDLDEYMKLGGGGDAAEGGTRVSEDEVEFDFDRADDTKIFAEIVQSDDPFDLVYNILSGDHGEEARMQLQPIYDDVVNDDHLHPDDDFEKIIDRMIDLIEADYGEGRPSMPYWTSPSSDDLAEAEYHGRKVPLGKKMQGDVKKSKVYVRKPNGKIVKVNFGDKTMRIKKSNPARRKSYRARHHCDNPGPRWKANYWSCRSW